jgi:hypothetical protein
MTANIAAIERDPGNRENQMSCGGDSNVASPVQRVRREARRGSEEAW